MKIGPNKPENINVDNDSKRYLEVLGVNGNLSNLLYQSPREANPVELPVVITKPASLEKIAEEKAIQKNLQVLENIDIQTSLQILARMESKVTNPLHYFGKGVLRGFFALPSACHLNYDRSKEDRWEVNGVSVMGFGYLLFGLPYITFYSILNSINEPMAAAVLGTQIITNVASGLYEWYKYENDKLIEEQNKPIALIENK